MNGTAGSGPAWAEVLPRAEYIVVPSRHRPLVVASRDPAVLRYLATSVLSVPPGTGPVLSLLLTIGLRAYRHPGLEFLAGPLCTHARFVTMGG
jgi:hypothetical protein